MALDGFIVVLAVLPPAPEVLAEIKTTIFDNAFCVYSPIRAFTQRNLK